MSNAVLDASALLALVLNEPFRDITMLDAEQRLISAVSLAEVHTRLLDLGGSFALLRQSTDIITATVPFTESQAILCGQLRAKTRHAGLSLGDRACLALAIELDADVYTADTAWAQLDLPCRIRLIR